MRMKLKRPASVFMLFLFGCWLIVQFIFGGVVAVMYLLGHPLNVMENLWIMGAIQLVGLLLPLFLWLLITGDSFKRNMPTRPLGSTNMILVIAMSFLIIPAAMLISAISSQFVTNDVAEMLQGLSAQPWWLMMLIFAVIPGVVEELVFRGYIQTNTRGSVTKIAVLNGFLFGLMHLNLHQFGYTFLLGVVFAYMVHYTKNIWAGIIPHFIMNGTNVTLSHWVLGNMENGAAEVTLAQELYDALAPTHPDFARRAYEWACGINEELFAIAAIGFIAVFATAVFAVLFVNFVSHNRRRAAMFETPQEEAPVEETEVSVEETEVTVETKRFSPDWCLIAVVVLYLLVVVPTTILLS